jgi:hypothetical protein
MSKLIIYPVIAIICIIILAILGYYLPNIAILIMALICVVVLSLFFIGIANLFNDWGENPIMYEIEKNKHYANHIIPKCRFVKKNHTITKTFTLTRSCLYHFADNDNSVNKLWGLTFGINPRKNSIRFGWNCQEGNGKISIFSFRHYNGEMLHEFLTEVDVDSPIEYTITINDNVCSMFVDNVYCGKWLLKTRRFVVLNKPYFGGNKTAPRDMILIQA